MPLEPIFRIIGLGDFSKATYRQRSPHRQAASAKVADKLVLP